MGALRMRAPPAKRKLFDNMQNSAGYWQEFVEFAELTDVGLRRANNQDSKACMLAGTELDFFRRGHLFMVADGSGGHAFATTVEEHNRNVEKWFAIRRARGEM